MNLPRWMKQNIIYKYYITKKLERMKREYELYMMEVRLKKLIIQILERHGYDWDVVTSRKEVKL